MCYRALSIGKSFYNCKYYFIRSNWFGKGSKIISHQLSDFFPIIKPTDSSHNYHWHFSVSPFSLKSSGSQLLKQVNPHFHVGYSSKFGANLTGCQNLVVI